MSGRTQRRLTFAALTVAVLVAFSIDLGITRAAVPGVPIPTCEDPADSFCQLDRERAIEERNERAEELETGIDQRSWVYLAVLAIGFIAFSVHFHSRGQETADIAADLGVSGILMIVLAFVISRETQTSSELVRVPPPGRLILVGFVLMGAAVVGAGMARWPRTSPPPPPPPGDGTAVPASPPPTDGAAPGASAPVPSWARTATFIGLGLAALTALLAVLQLLGVLAFDHVNVCEEDVPWWRQAVMFLASCSAIGSLACAAVVLLARRWFVSLVCIVVAPFAWFTAVMTNACIL